MTKGNLLNFKLFYEECPSKFYGIFRRSRRTEEGMKEEEEDMVALLTDDSSEEEEEEIEARGEAMDRQIDR